MLSAEQGVWDIEEVPDTEVFLRHPRLASLQIDSHVVALKRNRPEQAAWIGMDPWVEVVNLGGEVYEVEPTSVEIKSNEPERPPVNGAILADVDTFHKAHIGVEQELLDLAVRLCGSSGSPHVCDPDKALEIGNG